MALVKRISRLFGADISAVLDRLEDPEALLSLAIHEMEDELQRERAELATLRREHDALGTRKKRLESARVAIDSELDLCFEAGDEPLAKSMTRRKLQLAKLIENLSTRLEDAEAALAEREARLEQNEARLAEMRQQAEIFVDTGDGAIRPNDEVTELAITTDEVEVAYLREKQKRSGS